MYFRNNGLQKTWLNISLKSPLSEDPSTSRSPLPYCLSKELLKGEFLQICLSTFIGVHYFENTSAMRVTVEI